VTYQKPTYLLNAMRRKPRRIEDNYQITVANFLACMFRDALFTIAPSGMKLNHSIAKRLKAMGYRAGTPDIMIFEARGGYFGLHIEMKRPKDIDTDAGCLSAVQKVWRDEATKRGYQYVMCRGSEEACAAVTRYMAGSVTRVVNDPRIVAGEQADRVGGTNNE
jgi:hypothetical protein